MTQLPAALAALSAYAQFIIYKSVPSVTRPGKTDKLPCDHTTGILKSAHDPSIWTNAATAMEAAAKLGEPYGVGFVFTEQDPFFFVDIDNCLIAGQWSPIALQLCQALAGAAVEVSQSGKGLHIFGVGRPPAHGCRNDALGLEFYHSGRFVALTGAGAVGNCASDMSAVLPALVAQYFPPDASQGNDAEWTNEPDAEWRGPADDVDLIRRAMQSRSVNSAFGNRASFADLWLANEQVLARAYPDPVRTYNASAADAALAQHLAFWTGRNAERIHSLMNQSKLAREKWDREDYLPRTILGAVARQTEVLQDKPVEIPTQAMAVQQSGAPVATVIVGSRIANGEEQIKLFGGAVYVSDIHRALVPGGALLKPEQFRVRFGGWKFHLDQGNEKMSRDAWEVFTQSELIAFPRVDGTCFRPDLEPASVIEQDGQSFVNTYIKVDVPRKVGDAKPFLDHLAKVLPDARDREILLSYMAACVQHKGVKFQWAPLLQGVEGNGKTLFSRCVSEAIGQRYSHFPPASELAEKFNSWLFDSIFIGVEDIYVPNARQEVFEILKPMITSDYLAKRAMQADQVMRKVVANFMFNSNHRDALKKTKNDRRVCVLFCAQQQAEHLKRDGMVGDYFTGLYKWLRAGGYAIVSEYLHTYAIPAEFNPAGDCQRAPETTSTEEAIRASTGGVEQEIEEAIEQGLPGFCGGYISSAWLEKLLERLGLARRIYYSKRKEMLEQMGYRYHPALRDGRVNNMVLPDGTKSRLFVHDAAIARQIAGAAEVAKDYERANKGQTNPMPFSANYNRG